MARFLSRDLVLHLIAFQAMLVLIVLSNAALLRRAARHGLPQRCPRVSVLVPARNEERNIERCIASLLAQDYPALEVLVLDDQSTDETWPILERLAREDARLQILHGQPPPAGWLGKNWACAQLAALASGELLYFTDADTFHQAQTLRTAVAALEGERADLLSGFPLQIMRTWGERFIVPLFGWALYCFTPLWLAYRLKQPSLSMAVGQMLLFRREAYQAVGGHEAVRASIVEDMDLARQTVARGYRWRMLDATHLISCRMYHGGREAYAGLSKNLCAAFGFRVLPYLFVWVWLAVIFLQPPLVLGLYALGLAPQAQPAAIGLDMSLSLVLWLTSYWHLGLPPWLALLYPFALLAFESVAWGSLWLNVTGHVAWKGRALGHPRWRLL